jgi:hypothetical protein
MALSEILHVSLFPASLILHGMHLCLVYVAEILVFTAGSVLFDPV